MSGTMCVPGAYRGQKKMLDALEWELCQMWATSGYWELTLWPLEEHQMLFTSETSLQLLEYISWAHVGSNFILPMGPNLNYKRIN